MDQSLKVLLLAVWLGWTAGAQTVGVELLQEPLTPEEESYVQHGLNWMAQFYTEQGFHPRNQIKARVFANYAEFSEYQMVHRNFNDGSRPSPTAYYSVTADELVTWRTRTLKSLLIHESNHALLRSDFRHPPKWVNEGISECFEGFDFTGEQTLFLAQRPRLRKVKRYLTPDFGLRVVSVLDLSEREFNQAATDRGLDSYTRAWALVFYLWSKAGARGLGEMLQALKNGEPARDVLGRLLPGDLEQDLLSFYSRLELPPEGSSAPPR
ncbi:MAG: DUF1570 domain-containing protein [Candidatus Eremiobacteraeota bacterium]|nr:DUF1570 domain-containing protein [Candidatus Eremiobacteraeota bacterium]